MRRGGKEEVQKVSKRERRRTLFFKKARPFKKERENKREREKKQKIRISSA